MSRIVIVQPVIPLYTAALFERLAALPGIDLVVLADLETPAQLNQYNPEKHKFRAEHLAKRKVGGFAVRPGLLKKLRELRPDAVVFSGDPREISQLGASIWYRVKGTPVGFWSMFHRIGNPRLWTEIFMRLIGRIGQVLMSYGERGRREQLARGVRDDKIVVLGTAIDETKVIQRRDEITDDDAAEFRKKKNLDGKRVLLHLVRLTSIKRPDVMLDAFNRLARMRADVVLVWIGGGPLEPEIKAKAKELGLMDRMMFVGPLYDEHELGLWYRVSDVFVMATCIGLSIHHAMCYGLPVITDDSPLTQTSEYEVLEHGVNGLHYRTGDMDDFVAQICRLLDDNELRQKYGAAARRTIEQKYTMKHKVANFELSFRRLLNVHQVHPKQPAERMTVQS